MVDYRKPLSYLTCQPTLPAWLLTLSERNVNSNR